MRPRAPRWPLQAMKGFGGAKQRLLDKLTSGKTARRFLPRLMATNEALAKRGLGDLTLQELEDILEEEDESLDQTGEGPDLFFSVLVPPPKQLTLERQLHKSVLISWSHPDGCPPAAVDSYHVYVDGVLKTTVKATERPRALVEGVDSTRPHRISVRSITPNRRTSRDAACTMVVGKDVPQAPSNVKAGNVTSTSAVISWLPANSNHQHVVCVNNVEVRTVKPGVYRHTITGLAPNTVYRVTVRAKNIRQQTQSFDDKTSTLQLERCSAHIDFRTLPKGLPDPPVDIQVEAGPQDGTLLVTWLPVAGGGGVHTNGAPVTGYAVYADGKKVTDVDSPTGDHALIDINKLLGLNPRQVTVRTKSRDSQSSDSLPTSIPGSILRKGAKDGRDGLKDDRRGRFGPGAGAGPLRHHAGGRARLDAHGQLVIEPDESLSDKEVYPANHMNIPAIEITKDSASEANFSEDDYLDRRGGRYGHHMGGAGAGPGATHYTPRSHAERGRPPPLPHERAGRQDYGPRDARRDDRDMYYAEGQRGRHGAAGERGYRGAGGPGAGGAGGAGGARGPGGAAQAQAHHGAAGRDKRMRWFMALFDYDPAKDSPNPDACEEELTFNQGDTIKVYGEKDADGFYWGELRGRRGYVPHNMVMEVQEGAGGAGGGAGGRGHEGAARGGPHATRDRWGDIYANMPVKRMIALYDYDPQELSPNVDSEVELSFNTGNIIYVYGEMDDDGFYMGELDGMRGLVPSNFLTEAPPDYEYEGGGRGGRGGRGPSGAAGPGARGPPPPPRDGRMDPRAMDRRKDACQAPNQLDYRGDSMAQGPGGLRMRGGQRGDRRSGSGRPPTDLPPHMDQQAQGGAGHGGGPGKQPSPQQQQQQQQQQQPSKPLKGIPSVVPDFVIPNNKESPTAPGPTQSTSKFPDAPNLMQKFSEITGGADTSVDNIISKGKELIFMKFGLGK
ncbi:hypothetical protein R5R35_007103 [Gryllus longicercus]|uniref:RIMS-binding protein 2 n=1 Tax=Gryllus longicercus TaxID=2509291 RepID=A0AAN9VZN4_9ORTH